MGLSKVYKIQQYVAESDMKCLYADNNNTPYKPSFRGSKVPIQPDKWWILFIIHPHINKWWPSSLKQQLLIKVGGSSPLLGIRFESTRHLEL